MMKKEYKWKKSYSWVIVANCIYIAIFVVIMQLFS